MKSGINLTILFFLEFLPKFFLEESNALILAVDKMTRWLLIVLDAQFTDTCDESELLWFAISGEDPWLRGSKLAFVKCNKVWCFLEQTLHLLCDWQFCRKLPFRRQLMHSFNSRILEFLCSLLNLVNSLQLLIMCSPSHIAWNI